MRLPRRALLASLLATLLAGGCARGAPSRSDAQATNPGQVVARVNGQSITVGDLDDWIKDALFRQATRNRDPEQLHALRERALDKMIDDQLLAAEAKRKGIDPDTLLREETAKDTLVSDADVKTFYEANKGRFGSLSLEQATPYVRRQLEANRSREARDRYFAELRKQAKVEIDLREPRIHVAAKGPSRGPHDAPVTIVEFSDFECPFCRRVEPTVEELLKRYPKRVRLVYRYFPLTNIHPHSMAAAEAAVCADDQSQFWPYHDTLFQHAPALSNEDLERYAKDTGLDVEKFRTCLQSKQPASVVEADLAAGKAAGVSGTPTFFVNGIPISGAQPLDRFVRLVESELQRVGKSGSPTAGPATSSDPEPAAGRNEKPEKAPPQGS